MTDVKTCGTTKDSGEPCGVSFGLCSCHGRCFSHAPCREDEREKARQRGGFATARKNGHLRPGEVPPEPRTMQDVVLWYAWSIRAVVVGDLDATKGNTLKGLLKGLRNALEAMESREKLEEIRREIVEAAGVDVPELEALP